MMSDNGETLRSLSRFTSVANLDQVFGLRNFHTTGLDDVNRTEMIGDATYGGSMVVIGGHLDRIFICTFILQLPPMFAKSFLRL